MRSVSPSAAASIAAASTGSFPRGATPISAAKAVPARLEPRQPTAARRAARMRNLSRKRKPLYGGSRCDLLLSAAGSVPGAFRPFRLAAAPSAGRRVVVDLARELVLQRDHFVELFVDVAARPLGKI